LARVASVIPQIIKDPIGFFNNLAAGLKQGFQNFANNIVQHLKKGLIGWLTGTLAGAGIQIPEKFDLQGIFSLVAQVAGLGYEMVRARLVKRLGEEKVSHMEQTVSVFQMLATKGIAGIWQLVQEKVGDLKAMLLDPIQEFIIESVVKAGVLWVISLMNPASAFVRACKAIYDLVTFFMENAERIANFINTLLDSIVAVAAGNVAQVVKNIESALAQAIPLVLELLAKLLGLGNISQKVQSIIQKLQKPVKGAIDSVIDQAVKAAKFVGQKTGFGKGSQERTNKDTKGKAGTSDERNMQQKTSALKAGVAAADQMLKDENISVEQVKKRLPAIKAKYKMVSLNVVKDKKTSEEDIFHVEGKVNPEMTGSGTDRSPLSRVEEKKEKEKSVAVAVKFFMMNKQKNLKKQNLANQVIWINTLKAQSNTSGGDSPQEKVLAEQQAMIKRHFLAQAVFGVQGGTQYKPAKSKKLGIIGKNTSEIKEDYKPIEEFKKDGVSANLATLASGGGRFNYRSTDGSGDKFNKFLLFGDSKSLRDIDEDRAKKRTPDGKLSNTLMGAYKRPSTHDASFANNKIREVDKKFGGAKSTGFDIPIGGVGVELEDTKGRTVTTGYQGISTAKANKKNKEKEYQTGHMLHHHASSGDSSVTLVAFEGSAPNTDNIHGGSHGAVATVKKKVFGGSSEKTLTGQDKRSKLGLPPKEGGIKSDVTKEKLSTLEGFEAKLKMLRESQYEAEKRKEQEFYNKLLATKTQKERDDLLAELIPKNKQLNRVKLQHTQLERLKLEGYEPNEA
jgi:hypothetical protein